MGRGSGWQRVGSVCRFEGQPDDARECDSNVLRGSKVIVMNVRQATSADWPAIEKLLKSSDLPLDGARDHIGGFVVAENDGSIAGCAALERYAQTALLRS